MRTMKPPTRFIRHKTADEDLADLVGSYQNLMHLCEAFDRGTRSLASLIAVEIANLVADEGRDQSPILLRFPRAKEFEFCSTPQWFELPPGAVIAGKFNLLVWESARTAERDGHMNLVRSSVPRCWQYRVTETWPSWKLMDFGTWWEGQIVMSESHTVSADGSKTAYSFTRRGLIKSFRNAKGAHSRALIKADEQPLNDPHAFTMEITCSSAISSEENIGRAIEVLPAQAAARQIGEELLQSINHNTSKVVSGR